MQKRKCLTTHHKKSGNGVVPELTSSASNPGQEPIFFPSFRFALFSRVCSSVIKDAYRSTRKHIMVHTEMSK